MSWASPPIPPAHGSPNSPATCSRTSTRLVRWEPGLDTSPSGVIRHEWVEEVYLLEGSHHDLTLDETFSAGHFAARPPGMAHGPYRTAEGCVMLEIRYRP
ncbi:cupin domain-containing protein [Streptomyces sp. 110]|uniref:Cupin domain-containing protein n=1 Tax=Streptomyces endocoffeicus TaxID=2898945 RepID=A0ABS1Q4Y6_9ACTN|nr:cupin domain-containing protein [Streptomyces endocoffeicus]MBL1119753.1 cupin domain-containing protein [Streptomyces endocoffeicus]